MYTFISLVLGLAFFFGGAYYSLRFFSKLSEINMITAYRWGFKAKRFELVLTFILFYIFAFIMVASFVQRPIMIANVKVAHVGGLLGYQSDEYEMQVFDLEQNEYIEYKNYSPLPTATSFKDVFRVISMYKPFGADYYMNVTDMGVFPTVMIILIGAIGLVLMYFILYGLAQMYVTKNRLSNTITHQSIAEKFRQVVRLPFKKVLLYMLLVVGVLTFISGKTVHEIGNKYKQRFLTDQEAFRSQLEVKVSPGDILTGRVQRRTFDIIKVYNRSDSRDVDDAEYYKMAYYVIEFEGLLRIPVYLGMTFYHEGELSDTVKKLDAVFPDEKATVADQRMTFSFQVDEDYSVSLYNEKQIIPSTMDSDLFPEENFKNIH
jgi:hypothetical protein